ncbi:putative Late nodulin [Medicago truncatula]|uniref:Nodule Cysteine-Rich (NCR) secreted peptide n=1 Tax=Medicago truncatula TaxID=3880 RepID=G7IT79_MEDTR|nr:Nodule Cysteine-Rich (NCR) secreted peptide [Medicago truncatula]AFK43857.1 unknown [Medicago truncatula]RHN74378.1 putative Late nodulin [Medicago truncatula]
MQKKKNMAQMHLFVYIFIIILSLFIAVTNALIFCFEDINCPFDKCFPQLPKCINSFCECV